MSWPTMVALLLAAISVAVTLSLIDDPLGVAWDEPDKLRGVSKGRHAFYHPLFMIDLAQAAALVVQPPDLPSLALLVRVLDALAGGVLVFATFGLARLVLPDLPSLAAAAATAVTPLFIVHARIFKEDIFVAAFLRPSSTSFCRAGIAAGLSQQSLSFWLPSPRYRCRRGSTPPMLIRARSFRPSSRQAAHA